jgi:hypothetical protein
VATSTNSWTPDAKKDDDSVIGYFIPLAGFTETAIAQKQERRRTMMILLDAAENGNENGNFPPPA